MSIVSQEDLAKLLDWNKSVNISHPLANKAVWKAVGGGHAAICNYFIRAIKTFNSLLWGHSEHVNHRKPNIMKDRLIVLRWSLSTGRPLCFGLGLDHVQWDPADVPANGQVFYFTH